LLLDFLEEESEGDDFGDAGGRHEGMRVSLEEDGLSIHVHKEGIGSGGGDFGEGARAMAGGDDAREAECEASAYGHDFL